MYIKERSGIKIYFGQKEGAVHSSKMLLYPLASDLKYAWTF
jgi:hypothetical protein